MTSINAATTGTWTHIEPKSTQAPSTEHPVVSETPSASTLTALSDEQLRQIAAGLQDWNAGLSSAIDDFGSTAISLPAIESVTDLSALSTADLLQLIRAEARKTTELLLVATTEAIKNMQGQIDLNSQSSIAKLMEAATSQEKAEKMQKKMEIVKWVATGLGVLAIAALAVSAVATGGLTAATLLSAPMIMAGISAAMMGAMTCLSEIKDEEGRSPMDKMMEGLAKGMEKFAKSWGELPKWAQAAIIATVAAASVAAAIFAPASLALTLPLIAVLCVGTVPDDTLTDEQKAQIMANIVMVAVQVAVCVVAVSASSGIAANAASTAARTATASAETAAQAASSAAKTAATAARVSQSAELMEGLMNLANGGMGIAIADYQYDASMANATVRALKEMVKMLQTLLDGDADFIAMLAEIQAQLDAGCAEIIAAEFATQDNINREMFS